MHHCSRVADEIAEGRRSFFANTSQCGLQCGFGLLFQIKRQMWQNCIGSMYMYSVHNIHVLQIFRYGFLQF